MKFLDIKQFTMSLNSVNESFDGGMKMEVTNGHIGFEFYEVNLKAGIILTNKITEVTEDKVVVIVDGEQLNMSKRHYHPEFKTKEECEKQLNDEVQRINENMSNKDLLMKYVYEKVLLPTSELGYYDNIGGASLSQLELDIFKSKCKEFFGIEL